MNFVGPLRQKPSGYAEEARSPISLTGKGARLKSEYLSKMCRFDSYMGHRADWVGSSNHGGCQGGNSNRRVGSMATYIVRDERVGMVVGVILAKSLARARQRAPRGCQLINLKNAGERLRQRAGLPPRRRSLFAGGGGDG